MTKACIYCGQALDERMAFCTNCGKSQPMIYQAGHRKPVITAALLLVGLVIGFSLGASIPQGRNTAIIQTLIQTSQTTTTETQQSLITITDRSVSPATISLTTTVTAFRTSSLTVVSYQFTTITRAGATTQRGNCDPSYPTVCIPPPPPDLDCKDIPYRNFIVLPPDPHHFDGDGDGIGCET